MYLKAVPGDQVVISLFKSPTLRSLFLMISTVLFCIRSRTFYSNCNDCHSHILTVIIYYYY